jgi:hypothetical protein
MIKMMAMKMNQRMNREVARLLLKMPMMGQLKNRSPMTNRNIQISRFIEGYSNIIYHRLPYPRCLGAVAAVPDWT